MLKALFFTAILGFCLCVTLGLAYEEAQKDRRGGSVSFYFLAFVCTAFYGSVIGSIWLHVIPQLAHIKHAVLLIACILAVRYGCMAFRWMMHRSIVTLWQHRAQLERQRLRGIEMEFAN